jgi:hypothetical protein
MPTGTPVDRQYQAIKKSLIASGKSKKAATSEAAATAQKRTGLSLATGRRPKGRR